MFTVSEAEATLIQTAYDDGGEFAAAVELRRLFPGIQGLEKAKQAALMIVGWKRPAAT